MKFFAKKNRLKVLHLPANIRWISDATAKAQNDIGIETRKMYITPVGVREDEDRKSLFIKPSYTGRRKSLAYLKYLLKSAEYFAYFTRLILWADVVHWQYGKRMWDKGSVLSNYDLTLVKLLKKTAIVQFHGGDLRDNEYWKTVVPWWSEAYSEEFFERIQKYARETQQDFAKADFCFALGYGMYPFVKKENIKRAIIMERSMELRSPKKRDILECRDKVKIVHAPSNPSVKGTKYVEDAIQNLKREFDIDFVLIENMPHEFVLDSLETADIVVDQLVTGEYGLFAVEGMNAGAAVISNVTDILRQAYPEDLPIVQADPNTIEDVLRELIKDPKMISELGQRGRKYVMKVHECHAALDGVLNAYLFAANRKGKKRVAKKINYFLHRMVASKK